MSILKLSNLSRVCQRALTGRLLKTWWQYDSEQSQQNTAGIFSTHQDPRTIENGHRSRLHVEYWHSMIIIEHDQRRRAVSPFRQVGMFAAECVSNQLLHTDGTCASMAASSHVCCCMAGCLKRSAGFFQIFRGNKPIMVIGDRDGSFVMTKGILCLRNEGTGI